MIEILANALLAGLSLWKSKEARKYTNKVINLKRDYYDEYNKETPDHAVLDNIEFELRRTGEAFYSKVGVEDSVPKS